MTASPAWHAHIECGGAVGSGFLFTDRHVLTCAHVVQYADRARLRFPGRPDLGETWATVAERGPWGGPVQDPGDVAVLELDQSLPVPPAVFAEVTEACGDRKLISYGFPYGYDTEGVLTELRATAQQLISGEWAQLEDLKGYGQPLAEGFSGSAAVLEESNAVVGMISANDPQARNGRMIPLQVLARHCPRLAEYIPTVGYQRAEKRELRDLVARTTDPGCDVDRLFSSATGQLGIAPPDGGLGSLWQAVWYLLSEARPRPDALPLAELTLRLADLVADGDLGRDLRTWSQTHRARFGQPAVFIPSPPARRWSPILVEIQRRGAGRNVFQVEVSAYRERNRRLVGEKRLPKSQVRDYVLERIDEAFREIDTQGRELIAFALPRAWHNQPVDQWARRRGSRTPLGCLSPVVVMDHDRRSSARLQYQLARMWAVLDEHGSSQVHRIECGSAQHPDRLSVQLQNVYEPVGFARPPRAPRDRELHRAALDAPSPILLWPRTGCEGGACSGRCSGGAFLDALARDLSALPPAELPQYVFELRKAAFLHEGERPHWAEDLSLVWEDPRRIPHTPRLNQSPVG